MNNNDLFKHVLKECMQIKLFKFISSYLLKIDSNEPFFI